MAQVDVAVATSSSGTGYSKRYSRQLWAYKTLGQPALTALDGLWRALRWIVASVIVGGLAVNVVVSLLTTGTFGLSDPRTWAIAQPILENPEGAYVAAGVTIFFILMTFAGHKANSLVIPPELRIFQVGRVGRKEAGDYLRSFNPFYLPRRLSGSHVEGGNLPVMAGGADAAAQQALKNSSRRKAVQGSGEPIGTCVYGQSMLGTTRLAWQAMRNELSPWTFMIWPENAPLGTWYQVFRILQRRHAKLVLWLDELSKYASTPGLVAYINSLPAWIEANGIHFVIVATCHEEDESGPIHQHFAPLLQRLTPVTPSKITRDEARDLAAALARAGQPVEFNERAFDGLPGSLVFGIEHLRNVVYPNLGQPAQLVLKTIKLLRSAGILEYTMQRVIVSARDVFHLHPDQVVTAIDTLKGTPFLLAGPPTSEGQLTVVVGADIFLDLAVPDYTKSEDAHVDWPLLQESLDHIRDGRALARLGDSFREIEDFAHAEQCYERALPAFKRDSAPLEWANLQYGLGLVLTRRAAEVQDPERTKLLERAQDSFTRVLAVVNQQNDPVMWVGSLEAWRAVLRRQLRRDSTSTAAPSRITSIDKALAAARRDANAAKSSNPSARAEAQLNVGVLQFLQARFEQDASTRRSQLILAIRTYEQALSIITADSDPTLWARAQSSLGDVCRARADAAFKPARVEFLTRAIQAYQESLRVLIPERTHHDRAELLHQLAETLDLLAALKEPNDQLELLRQAEQALRQAIAEFRSEQYQIERAEAQCLLARVLGESAFHAEGDKSVELLTQGIIEYEGAIGVLDPNERERGDELRVRLAELFARRADARSEAVATNESRADLQRAIAFCDVVLRHEGAKTANPPLYREARALRRDAAAKVHDLGNAVV